MAGRQTFRNVSIFGEKSYVITFYHISEENAA
jgi:hypothetical protein